MGALLGGLKGALVAWVLLSVLALSAGVAPEGAARAVRASQLVDLAARYNVVERVAPDGAKTLERYRTRGEGEPVKR